MSRAPGLFEPELFLPSSAARNGPVLTSAQAIQLARKCAALHLELLKETIEEVPKRAQDRWSTCLDIEWLLVRQEDGRDPELVIIQARPCPIQWDEA
jgi:hypothetical protein